MTENANLYGHLRAAFDRHADEVFLRVPHGQTYTYRDADDHSARIASVLTAMGTSPGDRVMVQVEKSPMAVFLYLACLRTGIIYVPLNTAYTASELQYFVDDSDPELVVADSRVAMIPGIEWLTLDADGSGGLAEAAAAAAPHHDIMVVQTDDPAVMIYTSGTTGKSKGALLTHGNLVSNAVALHRIWGFEPGDVLLHCLPIFHVHGLMVALHTAMLNASEVIFIDRFNTTAVLDALPDATVMMGVPTHYSRLLADARFDAHRCRGMRLFTSGSAPMTEIVHAEITRRTGLEILERYGMSETGMITSNPYDGERVPGTVGFALPDVEIRVCDEGGQECEPGEVGVVEVRGPNVFSGYWGRPEKTAEAMRPDGFFITGDVGRVDAHGRLTLEGRASDMIISGGYNVYPKEVELVLDECPGILESAVVGVAHADLGEEVVAFVVREPGGLIDQDMLSAVMSDRLARFKQPRRFVEVDELPRNAMGKIQKSQLRSHTALLGGSPPLG